MSDSRRFASMSRLRVLAGALGVALALAACGGSAPIETTPEAVLTAAAADPDTEAEALGPDSDVAETTEAEELSLCQAAAPMLVVVERPFIGSDEHVEQFVTLATVAPADLLPAIETLEVHYRENVSPSNPDSQDFPNFPAHVQEAALYLDRELRGRC